MYSHTTTHDTMERDPRLLDLTLAAKYPRNNYSYPTSHNNSLSRSYDRESTSTMATIVPQTQQERQWQHRQSVSSQSSNPGMIPDTSDSDVEVEDDMAYHENTNQLWNSFWAQQAAEDQGQTPTNTVAQDRYPALVASPASNPLQKRAVAAAPYQQGNLHIVNSSVDSLHADDTSDLISTQWPLPPRGLSPSREQRPSSSSSHTRQSSRPSTSKASIPPRTSSLATPPSPQSRKSRPTTATRPPRPSGLSLFPGGSGKLTLSAPVTPSVFTPVDDCVPSTSSPSSPASSRPNSRARSHTQAAPLARQSHQPVGSNEFLKPASHTMPRSMSTPNLKNQVRPRTAPLREDGTRAPYYQEVSFLSTFPAALSNGGKTAPASPVMSPRSGASLSIIASYMDEDVPPVPSLPSSTTSSFSSTTTSSSQNVSVWELDSDDEEDEEEKEKTPRASGLSRILLPSQHKRTSSRPSSRENHRRAISATPPPTEPKPSGRRRADTVFSRMLGRRSRS